MTNLIYDILWIIKAIEILLYWNDNIVHEQYVRLKKQQRRLIFYDKSILKIPSMIFILEIIHVQALFNWLPEDLGRCSGLGVLVVGREQCNLLS